METNHAPHEAQDLRETRSAEQPENDLRAAAGGTAAGPKDAEIARPEVPETESESGRRSEVAEAPPKAGPNEVVFARADLLDTLKWLQAVTRRAAIFALQHVRMRDRGGGVEMTASDLEVWLTAIVPASVGGHHDIMLPIDKLHDIANTAPADCFVTITFGGDRASTVRAGNATYRLMRADPRDFPEMPAVPGPGGVMECRDLRFLMQRSAIAMCRDRKSRPGLCGIRLSVADGRLRAATSDTRMACIAAVDCPDGLAEMPPALLPSSALQHLTALHGDSGTVNVATHKEPTDLEAGRIVFEDDSRLMIARLYTDTFPNVDALFRQPVVSEIDIPTAAVADACERMTAVAVSVRSTWMVKFRAEPGALLVAAGGASERAVERIPMEYDGPVAMWAANLGQIPKLLRHMSGDMATLRFTENGSVCLADWGDPSTEYLVAGVNEAVEEGDFEVD